MSLSREDRRWEMLARELPFQQIIALRAQADGWRTGTAAALTILAAVAVAKGRSDLAQLEPVWRWIVVSAVVVAFAALVASLMISVRVANGSPGTTIWNTGEDLEGWTRDEVARGGALLAWAVRLAATGLSMLIVAMAVGWLAPAVTSDASRPVAVRVGTGTFCGHLVTTDVPPPSGVVPPTLVELDPNARC